MRISRRICVAFGSVAVVGACTGEREQPTPVVAVLPPQIAARDAWTRSADSGTTASVYFVLHNSVTTADTVIEVESDAAEQAMLHVSMEHGGTMRMAHLTSLPVPARDSVAFKPLGAHVMLSNLRRSLAEGDTVAVTLRFASGRTTIVRSGVRLP